jgi:hypothetical protein
LLNAVSRLVMSRNEQTWWRAGLKSRGVAADIYFARVTVNAEVMRVDVCLPLQHGELELKF